MPLPWIVGGALAAGAGYGTWELTRPRIRYTDDKGTVTQVSPNAIQDWRDGLLGWNVDENGRPVLDSSNATSVRARNTSKILDPVPSPRELDDRSFEQIKRLIQFQNEQSAPYRVPAATLREWELADDDRKNEIAREFLKSQQIHEGNMLGKKYGFDSKLLGQKHGYDMQLGQMQGDYGLVARDMDHKNAQSLAQMKLYGDSWNNWQQSIYGMANATSPARALLGVSRYM